MRNSKTALFLVTFGLLSFLVSCNTHESDKHSAGENCSFSFSKGHTELKWTAFKFTKRVGVGGTFDNYSVNDTNSEKTVEDTLSNLTFSINTDSVNSGQPERDKRIKDFFFGTLKNTGMITGKFKSLNSDGSGAISITINNITNNIPVHYKVMQGSDVEIWGNLDMESYSGLDAINTLNEQCKDLHTGDDGISKLWPDIEFRLFTKLSKDCEN